MEKLIDDVRSFTIRGYTELLQYLGKIYKIIPLHQSTREAAPSLALRHDVDYSLSSALKMAELEQELGVTATYFVLFSDRFYNLHERRNVQILRKISSLGHEVGLHYDPSQYRSHDSNMDKTLRIEIALLENLIGRRVHSIARHGPWDRDPFHAIRGYINANDPRWRGDLFIHDSLRAWTPFDAFSTLFSNPPRRVQLLVHPEYWKEDRIDRRTLLDSFFGVRDDENRNFKKELEKWWVRDPTVLEYEAKVASHTNPKIRSFSMPRLFPHKSQYQELKALFQWYLVNTTVGWKLHKATDDIRSFTARIKR